MIQVGHSRGIFDLSNCFCLDLNLEYVLMDFISRGSKFQATAPLYPTLWVNISLIGRVTFRVRPSSPLECAHRAHVCLSLWYPDSQGRLAVYKYN